MKRTLMLVLALTLVLTGTCIAEEFDFLAPMEETVTLTTARTMTETAVFDVNDPLKKNYQENLWTNTFLEKLNIDLDYSWIATDGDSDATKWAAAIAVGNVPDFATVDAKTYKMLLDAELVADCTDTFADYVSDDYKSLLPQDAIDQMVFDEKLMGLPFPTKGYHGATMLFVRQDWLDSLGLNYPTNYDELINVARAFKEAQLGGEETIGMMFSANASDGRLDGFMNMFGAYRNYWVDVDGRVEWSNVQPKMKDALLALQELYNEGIINNDFAVTTADLAKEYIAGGKTGVFFATSWNTTTSIEALLGNNPEAKITSHVLFGVDGSDIKFQTNTPATTKIFVSKNCKNLEAVAKMLNLTYALTSNKEDYLIYGVDANNFMWFKYLPYGDQPKSTLNDLINAHEIRVAYELYEKGEITDGNEYEGWTNADNANRFNNYVLCKKGESGSFWLALTYGTDGAYTKLYDAYQKGLHLSNAYVGLPTETEELMGAVIHDALDTAMFEVIMGADISVYETACETWLASGGQDITDEVNAALGK